MIRFLRFLGWVWLACADSLASSEPRPPIEALRLGEVEFPASGHPDAQPHFRRGIAALHSFWYPEALLAFQAALRIDPHFAMAWWGTAMCYNRPFLAGSNDEAGRRALAQIADTASLTPRERAYIDALRMYYANGTPDERTVAYARAMGNVYQEYPDDLDAAAFYALSLLGYRWSSEEGTARQERAGSVAAEVYRRNPAHPGAAHYIIHSFDEPRLASRALGAARHYAEIAPDAPHALHMPSHIFLQLGMWPEVIASNEVAWTASEAWVQRRQLQPIHRDYHNLHWLIFGCLQQGRYARASELLTRFQAMRNDIPPAAMHYLDDSVAAFVLETRSWRRASELMAIGASDKTVTEQVSAAEVCGQGVEGSLRRVAATTRSFITAYAAAVEGDSGAGRQRDELRMAATGTDGVAKFWRVRLLMVLAVAHAQAREFGPAIRMLREAVAIDEQLGRSPGPPSSFKPAHELFGEILLAAGEPAEALANFEHSLARNPNRPLSLLGAARAAVGAEQDAVAQERYSQLRDVWANADANLPELREAETFLKRDGARIRGR